MPTDGRRGFRKLNLKIESFLLPYLQAEARIQSILAAAAVRGGLGSAQVKRAVRRAVSDVLRDVDRAGIPTGTRLTQEAYALGVKIAGGSVDRQAQSEAMRLLIDSLTGRLTDSTVHVGRRVDDIFRKETLRAAAMVGGEEYEAAASLERALEGHGISGFTDSTGRAWRLSDYARMAVKTTTAEAVFHGSVQALNDQGLDLVDVNEVDSPCDRCLEYDGKTFSLNGNTSGYPILDIVFPIHPVCQHFIRASKKVRRAA